MTQASSIVCILILPVSGRLDFLHLNFTKVDRFGSLHRLLRYIEVWKLQLTDLLGGIKEVDAETTGVDLYNGYEQESAQ